MEGRIGQIPLVGDAISLSSVATPSNENPSQPGPGPGFDTGESESSEASERAGETPDKKTTSHTKTYLAMR